MARVPYLSKEDLPQEYQELFEVDEDDPNDGLVNVLRAMANNPRLLKAWSDWTWTLFDETGDSRLRELVILAVAKEVESRYVWHQHVRPALEAGVSREEILSIDGGDFEAFPPAELAALQYSTSLVAGRIDDGIHAELENFFNQDVIVAIGILASEYLQASTMIDAWAVELEDEFVGWQLQQLD